MATGLSGLEVDVVEVMTPAEMATLKRIEGRVQRGLAAFAEVVEGLAEIKEKRLWRGEYASWEEYLEVRWSFGDRRFRQIETAAEVVRSLPPGTIVPVNEAQARELAKIPEEFRPAVMEAAVTASPDGKPTAKAIKAAAARIVPAVGGGRKDEDSPAEDGNIAAQPDGDEAGKESMVQRESRVLEALPAEPEAEEGAEPEAEEGAEPEAEISQPPVEPVETVQTASPPTLHFRRVASQRLQLHQKTLVDVRSEAASGEIGVIEWVQPADPTDRVFVVHRDDAEVFARAILGGADRG